MITPRTPFPTSGYFGPAYFCDREDELIQLKRNVRGGNSTTLVALRRIGKTALIRHLYHNMGKSYLMIYVDILPTESMSELLNHFAAAVSSALPESSHLGKKIWKYIRSLRPVLTYDALQGTPLISINSTPEESKQSIAELFSILESQSKPVIIAIDEFQQILNYPEKNTDAWLRTIMQELNNVSFIFSGSEQHLMQDLFMNPERPFYRSTQMIKIGKIEHEKYRKFIVKTFEEHRKFVPEPVVDEILHWADCHTYYVQLICNRVFLASGKRINSELWKLEATKLLKEQEFVFYGYREMLTKPQWNLLKAIARDDLVLQPTSSEFISRHQLGNPATVLRSLKSLQKMELVYREIDPNGDRIYGIYDVLFKRWIT